MGLGINVITSNQASKLVQDSAFQVLSEGSLKAVARPAFTLMDKSASPEARKYSATKELIFQSVSMLMYFAIITTVFQRGGYKLLKNLGHTIVDVLPALVQVKTKGKFLKDWSGIRTDVDASLYINDKLIKKESGEIQLTNYGVSGICIFNLSSISLSK